MHRGVFQWDAGAESWPTAPFVVVSVLRISRKDALSPPAVARNLLSALQPSLCLPLSPSGSHPPILPSSHHLFPVGLPPLASLAAQLLIVSASSIPAGEGTKKQREPTDEGEGCLPLASHSCHYYYYSYLIIITQAVSFHDLHCPFSSSSSRSLILSFCLLILSSIPLRWAA